MKDAVAPAFEADIRQRAQRHESAGWRADQQIAHGLRIAASGLVEQHPQGRRPTALEDLGDARARVSGRYCIQYIRRPQPERPKPVGSRRDAQGGHVRTRTELHVRGAWDGPQLCRHVAGHAIQRREVRTKNTHLHRRRLARNRLADAIAQERHHFGLHAAEPLERFTQLFFDAGLFRARQIGLQLDVQLRAIGRPGVFARFGAPDLQRYGIDSLDLQDLPADALAEARHLRKAHPSRRRELRDEMTFAERRHQLDTEA